MFSSTSIALTPQRRSAASLARERLINDQAMRRNQLAHDTSAPIAAPPITYTFDRLPTWLDSQPVAETHLSPAEQQRQAIMICKTFHDHYLSKLIYLQDEQVALAILQPADIHKRTEGPLQIMVDSQGNTRVISHPQPLSRSAPPLPLRRLLLMGSVLTALASSLALILT